MTAFPDPSEYAGFYAGYIANVPEEDVLAAIEEQAAKTQKLLASLDETRARYRYAEGKWSIKEVLGHLTDAERVFAFRALCFSRGETQELPGFDENQYVANAGFDDWKLSDLVETYAIVRRATTLFFRNLPEEAWTRQGVANGSPVTLRALARIIVGHERHHVKVLQERYSL